MIRKDKDIERADLSSQDYDIAIEGTPPITEEEREQLRAYVIDLLYGDIETSNTIH